jgi:hypothetical protein
MSAITTETQTMAPAPVCQSCGAALPDDAPHGLCASCLLKQGLGSVGAASTGAGEPGRFVPPTPAELAPQFPQLEILELMGSGGMGAVYKARQRQLDRLVALKILPPVMADQPAFAERFAREARAMARLCHPHIVWLLDFGQTAGIHYLTMEFVDGVTLRQAIAARSLTPEQALVIVPQICEALAYAHEAGVVHRDIKPENILLDRHGRVKVADFGLAKLAGGQLAEWSLTGSRQVMGTPHYMAPEQFQSPRSVDHRADIYALGVVFYEMLTGELPLGRFAPPSQTSGVDPRIDDIVHKTLEKQPERRYQHASDVKTDVDGIVADSPGRRATAPIGGKLSTDATLRQVARDWWNDVRAVSGRRLLAALKLALFALYLLCMFDFLKVDGTEGTIIDREGRRYYRHTLGNSRTGRPWFRIEDTTARGFEVGIATEPDAWVGLAFALLAYYAFWRIKKTETGATRRFWFPLSHAAFWMLLAAILAFAGLNDDLHAAAMRLPWPVLF